MATPSRITRHGTNQTFQGSTMNMPNEFYVLQGLSQQPDVYHKAPLKCVGTRDLSQILIP